MSYFAGKVIAITGAGSGIGRETAIQLARRGARLSLADLNAAGVQETARLIGAKDTLTTDLDVTDFEQVTNFATKTREHFGVVHQLYNNAGISGRWRSLLDSDVDDYRQVFEVNVWGVIHGSKAFLQHLIDSGDGHLINVSSLNGLMAQPKGSGYVASKFAVRGFTETIRMEMIQAGAPVTVTVVHPGGVATAISSAGVAGEGSEDERHRAQVYNEKLLSMTPKKAVGIMLKAVEKRKGRVRIGQAVGVDRLVRLMPESYPKFIVTWDEKTFGTS